MTLTIAYLFLVSSIIPKVDAGTNQFSSVSLRALRIAEETQGIPQDLLVSLCYVESLLNPDAPNPNDGGSPSYGLCQIKYRTARDMGFKGKRKELYNPYINAIYAAKYLKSFKKSSKIDWIQAVAAYNCGHIPKNPITAYTTKVFKYYYMHKGFIKNESISN